MKRKIEVLSQIDRMSVRNLEKGQKSAIIYMTNQKKEFIKAFEVFFTALNKQQTTIKESDIEFSVLDGEEVIKINIEKKYKGTKKGGLIAYPCITGGDGMRIPEIIEGKVNFNNKSPFIYSASINKYTWTKGKNPNLNYSYS
jgi:hypothetical protein